MGKLLNKELCGFEDFPCLFELLQLPFGLLQLLFFMGNVVAKPVDLIKHHVHRGLLLPRLPCCLTWGCH